MFLKLSFKKPKLKREKTTFTDQQPYQLKINLNPREHQFYFLNFKNNVKRVLLCQPQNAPKIFQDFPQQNRKTSDSVFGRFSHDTGQLAEMTEKK